MSVYDSNRKFAKRNNYSELIELCGGNEVKALTIKRLLKSSYTEEERSERKQIKLRQVISR